MSDLISKSEEREWIENWFVMNSHYHPYAKKNTIPIGELYDILERMPTIDPAENGGCWGCQCALCGQYQGKVIQREVSTIEPKKAKWHKRNNVNFSPFDGSSEYEFTCGWCGGATDRMTNFCPNCGAKMERSEE